MKLKKADLAGEFQLIVKQEIKNYQDSLNFVLSTLRSLQEQITEIRAQQQVNYDVVCSKQHMLDVAIEELKKSQHAQVQEREFQVNDQRVINERNAAWMNDITGAIHRKICNDSSVDERLKKLSSQISQGEVALDRSHSTLNSRMDDLLLLFRKEILKTKKEIIEMPTEVSIVKKQLEEKIASHHLDVDGILREMRLSRHDMMVIEKKIENIYILIERLKKAEVRP